MKFNKGQKLFLTANTIAGFGMTVSNIFFNLYVYRYTNSSVNMIIFFNIVKYFAAQSAFMTGSFIANKKNPMRVFNIGMLMFVSMLVFAIVMGSIGTMSSILYVILVGIMWGAGEGFYWLSFNSIQQLLVEDNSRSKFFATVNILSGSTRLLAPVFSTFIISIFGLSGYPMIFMIITVNFIIACLLVMKIHIKYEEHISINIFDKMRFKKYPSLKFNFCMCTLYSFGDGITVALISIIYINAFNNDSIFYGKFAIVLALLVILSNFIAGKTTQKKKYKNILFIFAAIAIMLSGTLLGIMNSKESAIIYGIFYNMTAPFYHIPLVVMSFGIINSCSKNKSDMYVNITMREAALNLGRILALSLTLMLNNIFANGLYLALVITNSCFLITSIIYSKYGKRFISNSFDS